MSEVIQQDQPEQPHHQNQEQNGENATLNQQQTQDQTATTGNQQKRQLTIDTDPQEQTQSKQETIVPVVLSPRGDASQRLISQQSPTLLKGKLEVLRKLYNQNLQQFKSFEESERVFAEKKRQIDDLNTTLTVAQKEQIEKVDQAAHKVAQKQQTISLLSLTLQNLKSENTTATHAERVKSLNNEISNAQQRIHDREVDARNQTIQSRISEKVNSLTQTFEGLQNRRNQAQSLVNENRSKLIDGRSVLEATLNKLLQATTSSNSSAKLSELQTQQKHVEQQIQSRRQQIKNLMDELEAVRAKEGSIVDVQIPDLTGLKAEIQEAKNTKAQMQKDIEIQQREFKEVASKLKSNETAIENRKSKNAKIIEKTKKMEEEKSQLQKQAAEGQKKKQKFEEKVPEELVALRTRKAALQKEAKQQAQRVDKERNKEDNLVPASVIENITGKITKIKQQNQRYAKLVVQNASLKQENVKLDESKEQLEWQSNPDIKSAEANRQKEEVKYNSLEEEVNELRKKNVQVGTKLEEYVNEYPQFKPEKKQKKAEPVQPQQSAKKDNPQGGKKETQQPQVEEKGGKKKKNNNSSPQVSPAIVPEVKVEKPQPISVQPQSQPAIKKQEQKAGKGKNKSPKGKETEQQPQAPKKEKAPKKEEPRESPVKKQQPVKKVETVVKIEEAPKKQEAAKVVQGGQANKNKKKR